MTTQIRTQGFTLTSALEGYTLRGIRSGFGNRLDRINDIRVGLSDINGPKGGADKRCRIHIALPQQRDVVIEEVQPDLYRAIDVALRRAKHALERRLTKPQARKRKRRRLQDTEIKLAADAA